MHRSALLVGIVLLGTLGLPVNPAEAGDPAPASNDTPATTAPITAASPVWTATEDADSITTASGLRYLDLIDGEGAELTAGKVAVVDYTGWLLDGTKFDSSLDADPDDPESVPAPFKTRIPGRVIKGWNEGLLGMRIGGSRKLYIPADLAYGDQDRGEIIKANSTLIFTVQLHAIETFNPWTPEEDSAATTTASGLKIVEMNEGEGEPLTAGHHVKVNYTGYLLDGTMFDSSLAPSRTPFETNIPGPVIQGWNEGLLGMKVGGWRKLYIPANLAYGPTARATIPANSTLVFEIKLLEISSTHG